QGVDHVIALHVASGLEAGKIEIRTGYAMANADAFRASIYGTGAHGASPHRGTDPIFILAQVLNAIYAIPSRRINPVYPSEISDGGQHHRHDSQLQQRGTQTTARRTRQSLQRGESPGRGLPAGDSARLRRHLQRS